VNLFLVLVRPSGAPIEPQLRERYSATKCLRDLRVQWHDLAGMSLGVVTDEVGCAPTIAQWQTSVAVGAVRLDNRTELAHHVGCLANQVDDIELVARTLGQRGGRSIREILGDFAFVVWDAAQHSFCAARDAFGVRKLYYTQRPDLFVFSSRADVLADDDRYDLCALAELAAACNPSPERTVYADVHAIPPGSMAVLKHGRLEVARYWSPDTWGADDTTAGAEREHCGMFRDLLAEAVRLRLSGDTHTWAQLSGGLDSSSVVSMAQNLVEAGLVPHGVTGTISWAYRWSADSDEREYSGAVARRYQLRNVATLDNWFWQDDGVPPPVVDQPDVTYICYARDRRTCEIIRQAGGRVLLTGFGSDHYLLGNMFFFADWIASGAVWKALKEMVRRAQLGHTSFWNLAYQNAVLPLAPRFLQHLVVPKWSVPGWIVPGTARRFGLVNGRTAFRSYQGKIGCMYKHLVQRTVETIPGNLAIYAVMDDLVDVRHPFLYRPLVEFALQLPPEMCVQPHARKWVLREAMRGILPEVVRTRVGKGLNGGCTVQSLVHERRRIDGLLGDPLLAQLGCVDARKLRAAVETAQCTGNQDLSIAVTHTLAIEAWLQVKSDRWATGESITSRTAV
jgi:asparagine synthase (glutamine-hydrolysing)